MSDKTPAYRSVWRRTVNGYFNLYGLESKLPKYIIVNHDDFQDYVEYLEKKYNGIVPSMKGKVVFMGIPLGLSDDLSSGQAVLEI